MRSMVEGSRRNDPFHGAERVTTRHLPSTAVPAVPLPSEAGEDCRARIDSPPPLRIFRPFA